MGNGAAHLRSRRVQGVVVCSRFPQVVQQHRQLARHRHRRTFLGISATPLRNPPARRDEPDKGT
jgi:hypothetical protein